MNTKTNVALSLIIPVALTLSSRLTKLERLQGEMLQNIVGRKSGIN